MPLSGEALERFLLALGFNPAVELPRIISGELSLFDAVRHALSAFQCASDDQFVDFAFRILLGRYPDPRGRRFYLQQLRRRPDRDRVIRMILRSRIRRTESCPMTPTSYNGPFRRSS